MQGAAELLAYGTAVVIESDDERRPTDSLTSS
jgi:hypothetical protein